MIYVLSGKETYTLNKRKDELIKKSRIKKEDIITIDASNKSDFAMEAVINQCSTVSLFSERRAIVLTNPYFLKASTSKKTSGEKKKKKDNSEDFDLLSSYVLNPNPDTDLYFYCSGYDADKRSKEYKLLSSIEPSLITFIQCSQLKPWEMEQALDRALKERKIKLTPEAKKELLLRAGTSMSEVYRTMDKLEIYGGSSFSLEDIEHLSSNNPEVNTWKLGDCFLANDAVGTLRSLQEIQLSGTMNATALIPILASKIRQMYNVVRCKEHGLNLAQIAAKTGRKYPDKDLASAKGNNSRYYLKLLKELADLDQNIKAGKVNDTEGLELFLLRNLNRGR